MDLPQYLGDHWIRGQHQVYAARGQRDLYLTMPDNVWAVDARSGHEIWHYKYPDNPGVHIGSRGVGMYGDWLYFEHRTAI